MHVEVRWSRDSVVARRALPGLCSTPAPTTRWCWSSRRSKAADGTTRSAVVAAAAGGVGSGGGGSVSVGTRWATALNLWRPSCILGWRSCVLDVRAAASPPNSAGCAAATASPNTAKSSISVYHVRNSVLTSRIQKNATKPAPVVVGPTRPLCRNCSADIQGCPQKVTPIPSTQCITLKPANILSEIWV